MLSVEHHDREMEHQTGLEPATFCLENRYSTIELLMRLKLYDRFMLSTYTS